MVSTSSMCIPMSTSDFRNSSQCSAILLYATFLGLITVTAIQEMKVDRVGPYVLLGHQSSELK